MANLNKERKFSMSINIALDGPSGAGKSTIAKKVAEKLNYVYIDTGALYRAIAYSAVLRGIEPGSLDAVKQMLPQTKIELLHENGSQQVYCNGENVSDKIRTSEISMGAAKISALPPVREFLFDLQRDIAEKNNVIMDGRDIGTVVLPNADVKIYLTASSQTRASRRYEELLEKGEKCSYEQVLADIEQRDYNDMNREIAPLKKADDAVEVDSTSMTIEEVTDAIVAIVNEKIKKTDLPDSSEKTVQVNQQKSSDAYHLERVKRGAKLNPVRMFFYRILRWIVILIYKIAYNVKFVGKENIPKDGANIFASNHRSYHDPVLIAIPTRVPFSFMAKEELFQGSKPFKWLITAFGAFPVSRGKGDTGAMETSIERLNKGMNLVIFPEGTRSKDGKVGKGKSGVALIAAAAGVPVIPVGISFEGEKLKFRKKLTVSFGKVITPPKIDMSSISPRDLKSFKSQIMEAITELVENNVKQL